MKKLFKALLVISLIGLLVAIAGCGDKKEKSASESKKEQVQKVEKIRLGVDSAAFSLQFRVAQEKGIFAKYNIEPELSTYSFGIDTLNALVTNQVDTGEGMDYATLTRLGKGDLKVISLIGSPKATQQILFARNNITKAEDLKGKRLGVQKGTVNEYVWGKLLEKYKIDKKDVKFLPLQSFAELIAAYERGDIDAGWFNTTFFEKARNVKGSKELFDLSEINFRMRGFLVVQGSLVKEKPEAITNLLKALDEATEYIKKNPEEAADIAVKQLKLPKEGILKEVKSEYEYDVRFSQDDFNHLQDVLNWAVTDGLIKEKFELNDKIEIDPIKKALPDKVTYKP